MSKSSLHLAHAGPSGACIAPSTSSSAAKPPARRTDETGAVLPGVLIEVDSPVLIGGTRTAVSDGAGQYLIINLVASSEATYTVTFTLPGFSTFVRDRIVLTGEATANISGQLQVGTVEETITVTGSSPIVDVQNVQQQAVMTREIIDAIPTGRNYNNFAVLVPGMETATTYGVGQDVGGQSGQSFQEVVIHGGDENDQRVQVEGMPTNGWRTPSVSRLWISDGNFEEIQVDYAAGSAEVQGGGVQFNMIPRSGGNTFTSRNYFSISDPSLQTDNVSDELAEELLFEVNKLKELWTINPSIGGPIVRDKLWFFGSYTRNVADSFIAFQKDLDPNAMFFLAGPDHVFDDQNTHDAAVRLTWQATDNNKVQFYYNKSTICHCHFIIGTAVQSINIMDSGSPASTFDSQLFSATWTSTLSNRLLFEAGYSRFPAQAAWVNQPEVNPGVPGIFEVGIGRIGSRGFGGWYGARDTWNLNDVATTGRASLSYVTGSHSFKVGTKVVLADAPELYGGSSNAPGVGPFSIFTVVGSPVLANFAKWPQLSIDRSTDIGIFAQDQWTLDRLTINAGVRFDYFHAYYPDQQHTEGEYSPGVAVPGADVVTWKDLSPRLGVVYDLFGNGRTALKATASRFVQLQGPGISRAINPAFQNGTLTRVWIDRFCIPSAADPTASSCVAGDLIPQGDPTNPSPNGELLSASGNVNFGTPELTTFYDQEWANGWGQRFANWEFSGSVQHELTDGLSVNVSYFRRIYTNFSSTDNLTVTPADYDPFCVTTPNDPRLPTPGEQLCDNYQVKPEFFGLQDNITTSSDNFGTETRH